MKYAPLLGLLALTTTAQGELPKHQFDEHTLGLARYAVENGDYKMTQLEPGRFVERYTFTDTIRGIGDVTISYTNNINLRLARYSADDGPSFTADDSLFVSVHDEIREVNFQDVGLDGYVYPRSGDQIEITEYQTGTQPEIITEDFDSSQGVSARHLASDLTYIIWQALNGKT